MIVRRVALASVQIALLLLGYHLANAGAASDAPATT
jgi:hypothetical protein